MLNKLRNLFKKPKSKSGYDYYADKELDQYLAMCKKDITNNLSKSEGGIYIGSEPDGGIVLIAYGKSAIIREGFKSILQHPTLKNIFLEVFMKLEDYEDKTPKN